MKLQGTIQFTKDNYGNIYIYFEDKKSHVRFMTVTFTPDALGKSLFLTQQPCEIELRSVENIGKILEVKEEIVAYTNVYGNRQDVERSKRKALAPFEKDGWKGNLNDLGNSHKFSNYDEDSAIHTYRVSFTRFVEENDGKI